MLNQTRIEHESFSNVRQIVVSPENRLGVGVVVDKSVFVEEGGRKLVKAGTPLVGKLTERNRVFTVYSAEGGGSESPVGILEHDVDVTYGEGNGSLIVFGMINIARMDEVTQQKITDDVIAALPRLIFINEP